MSKKLAGVVLSVAVAGSVLMGCGSAGSTPAESDTTGAAVTSKSSASASNSAEETLTSSDSSENNSSSFGQDKNISAEINYWTRGEEIQRFLEGFNKEYPNIKVNITTVKNEDFLAKLTPAIANGQGVPDIFEGESAYVRYLVNAGVWDDLNGDPYYADTSDVWDYVKNVGTDDGGALRAISWQTTPGSIIYRRDIAEKVLGVSEPDDISKLLSTYDGMLDVAAKMKENGTHMFGSWEDVLLMVLSDRENPWVVDGKLVIDPKMEEFMDYAKTIHDNGYDLDVSEWASEWIAGVEDGSVFCYVLPTWGYSFVVKANANVSKGQWGLAEGPNPYVNGATWVGIYKDSPNKEAAWDFLSYMTLNSDVLKQYAIDYGEYVDLKTVDNELAEAEGDENLAGQNLYEFYNNVMDKNPHVTITEYDEQINSAYKSATRAYSEGKLTKDEALKQFKSDVANAYPDLEID